MSSTYITASLRNHLAYAGQCVSYCIKKPSAQPDLASLFCGSASDNYALSSELPEFSLKNFIAFPSALSSLFGDPASKPRLGLFQQISRIWIAAGRVLYLWNYTEPYVRAVAHRTSSRRHRSLDLVSYESPSAIACVALVPARASVFLEEVQHVLVLGTESDYRLLALSWSENQLHLHPTSYTIPCDAPSQASALLGTREGRIFAASRDGGLVEVLYESPSLLRPRTRLRAHRTWSLLESLVPAALRVGRGRDSLVALAVDEDRGLLYTLSQASVITLFDLGGPPCRASPRRVASVPSLLRAMDRPTQAQLASLHGDQLGSALHAIAVFPIAVAESSRAQVLIVTRGGYRCYFSTVAAGATPMGFYLLHCRFPPRVIATWDPASPPRPPSTHPSLVVDATHYARGTFLCSMKGGGSAPHQRPHDLFVAMKVVAAVATAAAPLPTEAPIAFPLDGGPLLQILEMSGSRDDGGSRRFAGVSRAGLTVVEQHGPAAQLVWALAEGAPLDALSRQHTAQALCAMALRLASATHDVAASPRVVALATSLFFHLAGHPTVQPGGVLDDGGPKQVVSLSTGHAAVATAMAQLIGALWFERLFVCITEQFRVRVNADRARGARAGLVRLRSFLDANPSSRRHPHGAAGAPPPSPIALAVESTFGAAAPPFTVHLPADVVAGGNALEQRTEDAAAYALDLAMRRLIESLDLCVLLHGVAFGAASIPPASRRDLADLTLERLVMHAVPRPAIRDLVHAIGGSSGAPSDPEALERLTYAIAERCPSHFDRSDPLRLRAAAILQQVDSLPDALASREARAQLLAHVVEIYREMLSSPAAPADISEMCRELLARGDTHGAVGLAMGALAGVAPPAIWPATLTEWFASTPPSPAAMLVAPIVRALDMIFCGAAPRSPEATAFARHEDLQPDEAAVAAAVDALASGGGDTPSTILRAVFAPENPTVDGAVYLWFLERRLAKPLVRLPTRTLETWLVARAGAAADLLWRLHVQRGAYLRAAVVLCELAETTDEALSFAQRLDHLSQAASLAAAAAEADRATAEAIKQKLEVARVQLRVHQELATLDPETCRGARVQLDRRLYQLAELQRDFVQKYGLCESALELLVLAAYPDDELIQRLWTTILEDQQLLWERTDRRLATLAPRLVGLFRRFGQRPRVFPIAFLVARLEDFSRDRVRNFAVDFEAGWVARTFLVAGVGPDDLVAAYLRLFEPPSGATCWGQHLAQAAAEAAALIIAGRSDQQRSAAQLARAAARALDWGDGSDSGDPGLPRFDLQAVQEVIRGVGSNHSLVL